MNGICFSLIIVKPSHSGESRTKAQSALNSRRLARRASKASNPLVKTGKQRNLWIPAFAGMTEGVKPFFIAQAKLFQHSVR